MKRILILTILTFLKIAIIFANSLHSSFFSICKVIADVFQLPAAHLLSESFTTENSTRKISSNSTKHSISIQTEEFIEHENAMEQYGTDVIIYNLNSTQKLVISQGTYKRNQCENCKSESKISEDVTAPSVDNEGLNASYMSIESDVLDSKIESCCLSYSNSSHGKVSLNAASEELEHPEDIGNSENEAFNRDSTSHEKEFRDSENFESGNLNTCNARMNESVDFECLKENIPNGTYVKYSGTNLQTQTSSPFSSTLNTSKQTQTRKCKDVGISVNTDNFKNNSSNKDFKRRLSLPVKLNTSNISTTNFKLAQQKLIEDALKNTPRHERSLKEIKYPFSSEISLDSKPSDEIEDKEVFSCSSYESLPVSDHLRNTFENNALLNLYDLHIRDEPYISSDDNFVEEFNDKIAQSLENINLSKIPFAVSSTKIIEEKDSDSLNTGENLQYSCFNASSLNEQKLKCKSKYSSDLKEISFGDDMDKCTISSFTSGINSNTSIKDVYEALDRLVASEKKHVSEKFASFCAETMRNNNKSDASSENDKESDVSVTNELSKSHMVENESIENSNLKPDYEQESVDGNNPIRMKYLSAENPLKLIRTCPLEKHTSAPNVVGNFENTDSSIKGNVAAEKLYSLNDSPIPFSRSYYKSMLIDEILTHEKNYSDINISETNIGDPSSNEEDELKHQKENISRYSQCEKSELEGLLPSYNRPCKSFEEILYEDKPSSQIECMISSSANMSLLVDQFEWTSDLENSVVGVKDKADLNNLSPTYLKRCEKFLNQSFQHIRSPTKQNISETKCPNLPSNQNKKPAMNRKKIRRNTRGKTCTRDSILKTNKSISDSLTNEQLLFNTTLLKDKTSHQEKDEACQEISNCLEHHYLKKDRKPITDETISSGDSTSDNSVETVKDLNVLENKIEENEISKKSLKKEASQNTI